MARYSRLRVGSLAVLAALVLTAGLGAQKAVGTASGTTTSAKAAESLAAARSALAKLQNSDALASSLEAYAYSLPAHDAVLLFREYLPKLDDQKKITLASLGGSLALMLGRYEDAAFIFGQVAHKDPLSGIEAARSYLAAGNVAQAGAVLDLLQGQLAAPGIEGKKNITRAWLFILEGRAADAFVLLKDLVQLQSGLGASGSESGKGAKAQADGTVEKEALFLLWILASSNDLGNFSASDAGYEASAMAALLEERYPRSVETSMVRRGILPAPSAWLLGAAFPFPEAGGAGGESEPGADPEQPAQAGAPQNGSSGDRPPQLQAGWFSRKDNAVNLSAILKKSGFAVTVEEQKTRDGQTRWAVIVNAEADWTKTQAKLKDLGYESYLLP